MFWSKWFKRRQVVTFHMRSGAQISARCTDFSITKNGNELMSYKADGVDKRRGDPWFYIRLEEVEAITIDK